MGAAVRNRDAEPDPWADDESPAAGEERGSRRQFVVTAALIVALLGAWGVTYLPSVAAWTHLGRPARSADTWDPRKEDPQPGLALANTAAGKKIKRAAAAAPRGLLLIHVGDCSSCLHADLRYWTTQAEQRGLRVMLLSTTTDELADFFTRSNGLTRVPIVCDPDGVVSGPLHAYFAPRGYLFGKDGRLLWLQREPLMQEDLPFDDEEFVAAKKALG